MMEKEIEITLRSPLFFLLLTILLYYFYLQLKVVLPNPIAFGDEGFHTAMARYIANNLEYPKYIPFEGTQLIKDGFYRPPLWNFLLASFLFFFGLNEFLPKIITLIITFLLGISTFVLIKRNFSEIYAFIVSILLVSFQSVITYTVLFYYADLLLFFVNLSILSFITYLKEKNKKFLILSSLFASLSFLTNQFALTLYVSFLFFIIFEHISTRNILKETLKQYLPFFLILLIVPSGYLIRNLFVYKTIFCFSLPFLKNIFDISECKIKYFEEKYKFVGQAIPISTEASVFSIGFMNYLDFAYFNPYLVILPFLIGLVLFFYSKESFTKFLIIYFFVFIALIIEIGKGRAEDAARYTLGFSPLFAIISGFAYWKFYEILEKRAKNLNYLLLILIIIISITIVKGRLITLNEVKKWDPSFFEACNWIKIKTEKNATISTIWGHNGAWCSERNMGSMLADILLSYDLEYILQVIKENQINYLWIQKGSIDPLNRGYADNYPIKFIRILVENPQYFIKVYENGERIESCYQACYGQTIYKVNITNF